MAALDVQAVKDRALGVLKGFSPSQLAIIGLLTVVALVGGLAFFKWVNAPTYDVLLAGLDPKDASAVTAQLTTDGVSYKLGTGGTTVLVPAASLDAERLKVAAAGLPANQTDSGWAVFDNQGMTSSTFQQQVAYQRALESTLGQTLTGIKGVSGATVHLSLPEKSVFTEQQQPARASVLLTTRSTLDDGAVDAVTRLVASSVPDLAPEDVSVSDDKGTLLTGGGSAHAGQAEATLEDQLSTRATSMLDTLLGPGHAVVRVSAELETATKSTDSETYDNSKTAVLSDDHSLETYDSSGATGTGGVVATPTTAPSSSASPGTGGYSKEQDSKQNGVSRTVTSVKDVPGGVKRLTVAVAVDSTVKNAPTQTDLQNLVANAVGLDPARGDTIAVTTPAFSAASSSATTATAGGALGSAKSVAPSILGGILLVLVALGLLRTVRRGSSTDLSAEEVTAALMQTGGGAALESGGLRELPAAQQHRALEGDSIVELVDEHPDEVAHLLRGWLASTGGEA